MGYFCALFCAYAGLRTVREVAVSEPRTFRVNDLTNAVGCAILDTKKRSNPMDFWGRGAYFGVKKLVVPKKKPKKKKTIGKTIFKKLF